MLSLLEREPDVAGVVTHSSGNHGQAVACAAQVAGLRATIVVPEGVTPAKVAGIRSFGATLVSDGVTYDNREEIAEEIARSEGLHLIHPYDDWDVVHGAGTVGLEILEDVPAPGAVVVPVGGGGQISGIALAIAASRRRRRSSVSSRRLPMTRLGVCAVGSCKPSPRIRRRSPRG